MSLFTALMGEDVSLVRASVASGYESRDSRYTQSVTYEKIDAHAMRRIYNFYMYDEVEIGTVNDLKDSFSLAAGVTFSFADDELDENRYPIKESIVSLMSEARRWHDMFGFVAVYNPDIELDRRRTEALTVEPPAALDRFQANGVAQITEALIDESLRLLNNIVPDQANEIAQSLGIAAPVAGTDDGSAAQAIVETLPRVSDSQAPGARLVISSRKRGASPTDDGGAAGERSRNRQRRDAAARTLDETINDLQKLRAVALDDGEFFVETDRLTMVRRVVFVRHYHPSSSGDASKAGRLDTVGEGRKSLLKIDPNVFVYVWDGRMPESDGRLHTAMFEVLRLRTGMDEVDRNLAAVDYARVHPVVLFEQQPAQFVTDADRMTDPQMYGGQGAMGANPSKEQLIAADAQNRMILQAQAAVQNGRAKSELVQEIASGRIGNTQRDANGRAIPVDVKARFDYVMLPPMVRASAVRLEPQVTTDIIVARHRFREALANALNVPLTLLNSSAAITGGRSASAGRNISMTSNEATNAASDKRLRSTVHADRGVLSRFVNTLWDVMYRDVDNRTFEEVLSRATTRARRQIEEHVAVMREAKAQLVTVTDLARQSLRSDVVGRAQAVAALNARLREIDRVVRQTLSMQYRFQVHFNNLSYMENVELASLRQLGVISPLEHVNALRIANGMTKLTQAAYDKNRNAQIDEDADKLESEAKIQAKYNQKTSAAGGGGSSAKKS